MQRRASLVQGLLAAFAISQVVSAFGCAQPASGGGTGGSNGTGTGGSSSGTGGSSSGTGGSSSHTGGSNGTGGSSSGTGGSSSGTGGGIQGTGGSHTGGSNGTGGSSSGTGGSSSGTGGMANGGAPGVGGMRACAAASSDVIADFEDGTNSNITQGGRQGWWSAFGDTTAGTQTPASSSSGPSAATAVSGAPTGDSCDMYAMHSTATGHTGSSAYVGFGASFAAVLPPPASGSTSKTQNPYDVSAYDGVSFNIKSGSGTAPPVWVEFHDTENVPSPDGTAKYSGVDQYNTRGILLTNVGASWTKVSVPFGIMAPRYLPNLSESDCSNASVVCQAPPWDAKNALGIQFGVYPQFAVQPFTSSTSLNYDLWVDDVTLYKGNDGLGTLNNGGTDTLPDKTYPGCTKVPGASGKYLTQMYNKWKSTFVTGTGNSTKVIRPENGNDTVSEGIGYGMLIAVYVGDHTLFDGLWGYAQTQMSGGLMNWCIPAGGGSCSASGGSATDADEDMAFALIQAGKRWGGTYASAASTMISAIWSKDIDGSSKIPTGGSNYGSTSSKPTNPSYFAPAFYKAFASVDAGHDWNGVATASYSALSSIAAKASKAGLVPAWCGSNCTSVSSNGGADDSVYQYDAHRVPWRFGIDACWNSATTGKTFLMNNASFFAGVAQTGVGRIADIYTLSGTPNSDAEPNSMSIIGTAGVGAMAAGNAAFAAAAWQFLLDASYSPASFIKDSGGKVAYTYFNATVGLLTALTLSGNFYPM
jgi:endo-1,4-beta-D-glucanase Y